MMVLYSHSFTFLSKKFHPLLYCSSVVGTNHCMIYSSIIVFLQNMQAKVPSARRGSNGANLRLIIYEIYDICNFLSPLQAKLKGLNR